MNETTETMYIYAQNLIEENRLPQTIAAQKISYKNNSLTIYYTNN